VVRFYNIICFDVKTIKKQSWESHFDEKVVFMLKVQQWKLKKPVCMFHKQFERVNSKKYARSRSNAD